MKEELFYWVKFALVLILVVFGFGLLRLGYKSYFAPKHAEVDREVFENTKSYVHGKTQDLAKYYREYQETEDMEDKAAIQEMIVMQFAEFDSKNVKNESLRRFLVNMRGF
jgi:hypothetical protein